MLELQLNTDVHDEFVHQVDDAWIRRTAEHTLAAAGVTEAAAISLVVVGDETVRNLNRNHRGIDATTDVLAFAFAKTEIGEDQLFALPPDSAPDLGEVIISLPQAERQARDHRHPLEHEVALLIAHGVLHLLGYDHDTPEDEQRMRDVEAKALASLDIS